MHTRLQRCMFEALEMGTSSDRNAPELAVLQIDSGAHPGTRMRPIALSFIEKRIRQQQASHCVLSGELHWGGIGGVHVMRVRLKQALKHHYLFKYNKK